MASHPAVDSGGGGAPSAPAGPTAPGESRGWAWASARVPTIVHTAARLADTERLAESLADLLEPGDLVALTGGLGAGKTAFVRAACRALGVPREEGVKSPSFALIHVYEGGSLPVAHLDLYRLGDAEELEALGFRDLLAGEHVLLVEWPERAPEVLAMADVTVRFRWVPGDPGARSLSVTAPDAELFAGLARSLGLGPRAAAGS